MKNTEIWIVMLLSVIFISGCCVKPGYRSQQVTSIRTWDRSVYGNQGIGPEGYFYPEEYKEMEISEGIKVVEEQEYVIEEPIVQEEEEDFVLTEFQEAQRYQEEQEGEVEVKKLRRDREWCQIKHRTVVPKQDILVVADFDSGKRPNNLGYNFGAWDKDPKDFTQTAIDSFSPIIKKGMSGNSLQVYYDVDSPVTAYNGFWCALDDTIDYSVFKKVGFSIKGDEDRGFSKVVKIELKNCLQETAIYYLTGITDKWQDVVIPFEKFSGSIEWILLTEFVITFEDRVATDKEGAIYIDNIYFQK